MSFSRFILCFLAAALSCSAADVRFTLQSFTGRVVNFPITLTPTAPLAVNGPNLITSSSFRLTPSNGVAYASNLLAGDYVMTIENTAARVTLTVPETNALLEASALVSVVPTAAAGLAYSKTASDERYWLRGTTNAVITNNQSSVTLSGTFIGDGTGLANVPSVDASAVPFAGNVLDLPGPDGLRTMTHPNLLSLRTNWNGYQHWLTATPYPNALREEPCLWASRDLVNWIPTGPFPTVTRLAGLAAAGYGSNGWLADSELYLDPSGVLRMLFIAMSDQGGGNYLFSVLATSSSTGTNWTTPAVLKSWASLPFASAAGPQIVSTPSGLRLYAVDDGNLGTNALYYVAGLDTSGTNWDWANPVYSTLKTFAPSNSAPWHFDMVCDAAGNYSMFHCAQDGRLGEWSTSTNGINWFAAAHSFLSYPGWLPTGASGGYKPAMEPVAGAPGSYNLILGSYGNDTSSVGDTNLGWRVSLFRGLTLPPPTAPAQVDTNMLIVGGAPSEIPGTRPGRLVVRDAASFNQGSATVAMGHAAAGYAAISFSGTNLSAQGAALLGDRALTVVNVPHSSGVLRLAQGNTTRAGVNASGGLWVGGLVNTTTPLGAISATNGFYGDGASLSNVIATGLSSGANVTNLSLRGETTLYAGATPVLQTLADSPGALTGSGAWSIPQVSSTNFIGNGANLTNLAAGAIAGGTLNASRLPSALALESFTGQYTNSAVLRTNANRYVARELISSSSGPLAVTYPFYWTGSAYAIDNSLGYGLGALLEATNCYGSTANGYTAMSRADNCYGSMANGYAAMYQAVKSYWSTANGYTAMYTSANCYGSTANGYTAMYQATNCYNSVVNGFYATRQAVDSYNSVANGSSAMFRAVNTYNSVAEGANALRQNNWPNRTSIGYQSAAWFPTNPATAQSFYLTNLTANTITFPSAHGFGSSGRLNLRYYTMAGTPPTGLATDTIYPFTITSTNVLTLSGVGTNASADFVGRLVNSIDLTGSIAIGADANPTKANQAVLGHTNITETVLRGQVIAGGTVTASNYVVRGTSVTNRAVDWSADTNAWEDLQFPIALLAPPGTPSPGVYVWTNGPSSDQLALVMGGGNSLWLTAQMPHTWVAGTPLFPRLHVESQTGATNTTVWRTSYQIADIGKTNVASVVVTNTITIPANQRYVHLLRGLTPSGMDTTGTTGPSTIIKCKVDLISATEDIHILMGDIHYRTGGSPQPFTN